jgi:RimJ/RimL family protein N-acetyltransferase
MEGGSRPSGRILAGSRVRLRPLERADLPRYQELLSDPEINLFYGDLGVPDSLARLQRRYDAGEFDATDRYLHLVIEAGDTLIGQVSLKNDENLPSRTATFGIFIGDRAYLGHGYGTEATISTWTSSSTTPPHGPSTRSWASFTRAARTAGRAAASGTKF